MTLFKQISLLVSLIFLLLIMATIVGDFRRSSDFLEGQLQTSAQDIATTLGISISNSTMGSDVASLEALFNSVFDSGYYTRIELTDPNGKLIHKKEQKLEIRKVPNWFISLVPLRKATGTSRIQQGWIPVGQLSITVHPGFTYASLYQNLKATLLWAVVLLLAGLALLWFLLHKLMSPLERLRQQAEAIHANQFVQQSELPTTLELRRVVETMNRMVAKVQAIFTDHQQTLVRYQDLLYTDSLTGLANRKYIVNQLEQSQSEEATNYAAMVIFKLHGLEAVRDNKGYDVADELVCLAANLLNRHCVIDVDEKCARMAEDEFAVLACTEIDTILERIQTSFDQFREKASRLSEPHRVSLTAGVTRLQIGWSVSDVLSDADFALTLASGKSPYSVTETTRTDMRLPHGKRQWRIWLEESLANNRLYLASQPVFDIDGRAVQQEVFVRLRNEDDEVIPAGMFMPMALALGFGLEIDRTVFKLLGKVVNVNTDAPVALNLTASFFNNHCYISQEFSDLLAIFEDSPAGLCMEASHTVFNQYPSMCTQVADRLRLLGHQFGIDNFDLSEPLGVLQAIRPSYIKINANTLLDLTNKDVSSAYQILRTLVKTLDIQLIAVGVGTQETYDHLRKLGVETMQGNLLAEPRDLL